MKIKTIIWLIFTIIIVSILFKSIFYPAYLSVASGCGQISDEELFDLGYQIAGNTKVQDGNITIEIFVEDEDNKHKKHELIHRNQLLAGIISLKCEDPIQKYFSEVQAYSFSYIPDRIFIFLFVDFRESESLIC